MGYDITPSNAHIQLHDKQKYRLYALRTTIWQGTQSHFQWRKWKIDLPKTNRRFAITTWKLDETRKSIREYQDFNIPSKSYTPIENNDLILVRNFNAKSFEPQWKEPLPVVRHDKYTMYHIQENTEVKQYHRSDIKPFISGEQNEPNTSHSDPSSINFPESSY